MMGCIGTMEPNPRKTKPLTHAERRRVIEAPLGIVVHGHSYRWNGFTPRKNLVYSQRTKQVDWEFTVMEEL